MKTMTDELKLKPCPFCGGEAIRGIACHVNEDYAFRVECRECKIVTPFYDTEADAIKAWNRRAERTAKVEKVTRVSSVIRTGRCGDCGYDVIDSYKHCPNCGAKLVWSERSKVVMRGDR